MSPALRRIAPFLVMLGAFLMPSRGRPTPFVPPPRQPSATGADEPPVERHTTDPGQVHDASRGRLAEAPHEIPRKGWKDIFVRAWREFREDQIPLISAGVTFYVLLSLFPALGAFVALYGLFADVATVQEHLQVLAVILPVDALQFFSEQMIRIAESHDSGLSLAFVGGLLLSIWSANGAMKAIIAALNIAYEETEKRKFFAKTATSLAFTLGFLVFAFAAIAVLAAPTAIAPLLGEAAAATFRAISLPGLVAAMGLGLATLYRYGPSRDRMKWRWISWGSGAALLLWLAASAAFSVYVSNFAHYEKTYGSLGAVIGLMMWVYVSVQVILLGAELNSEIEHQTARDTTVGPERPLGERGAVMADTIGAPQE